MKRLLLLVIFSVGFVTLTMAGTPRIKQWRTKLFEKVVAKENPRVMASFLCVAIGPFGGHRLYLGTNEKVPIAYTLTLGGGLGVLPAIDLLHIAFAKDLSQYQNNPKVIMWLK